MPKFSKVKQQRERNSDFTTYRLQNSNVQSVCNTTLSSAGVEKKNTGNKDYGSWSDRVTGVKDIIF